MVLFGMLCVPLNETRSIAQGWKKQRIFCGRGRFAVLPIGQPALAPPRIFPKNPPMSPTATRAGARHRQSFDLQTYLADRTATVNRALDRFLPRAATRPATIYRAM